MYTIYTTPGFIIGSKPHGEAGKILFIFTRDFGSIAVVAQGIRLEKSKLRYCAQEYSFGTFSLVKGKEFWRLTSVSEVNHDEEVLFGKASKELIARMALLLRRLLQGEVAHPELFDCLRSGIEFLELTSLIGKEKAPEKEDILTREITDEQLKTLESVIVFKMLELLGYVGKDKSLQDLGLSQSGLSTEPKNIFSIEFLDELALKRVVINQHINKALRESQL